MQYVRLDKKSGAPKNEPGISKLAESELQDRDAEPNPVEKNTGRGLLIAAIVLLILMFFFCAAVAGLSIYSTVIVETEVVQMIELLNGNRSGLEIIVDGTTVFLYNTGVHNVTGGPGIIINETDPQIPVISLNASFINCTGNGGDCALNCTNSTIFQNTTDFFNCSTCFFNGTCDCVNVTNVSQNITINNITDIIINNVTIFSNASCCQTIILPGPGIDVTGSMGSQMVINTGVLNISVGTGLIETGPYNTPTIATDFLAGLGISLSGSNPLIFNNTGVIQIVAGQNIVVTSSNGDGTGIVTISLPFQINNIDAGLGINITQNATDTVIINDGVLQNIAGQGIGITSSFGNGKGIVNVTNTGVIQIFGGPGVNITGTQQFPIVNFQAIQINALTGIFINGSDSVFNVGNTGVLQVVPGNGILVSPPSGTGVVNISTTCVTNLTAGIAISITASGTTRTIAANLQAGSGIALSGSHPEIITADIVAGSGVAFTGTHPIVISSSGFNTIVSTPTITATTTSPGVYQCNLFVGKVLQVILKTVYPKNPIPNCNIGFANASVGTYWTCNSNLVGNLCGSGGEWDMLASEYTIPQNGTYYISYSVEDRFAQTGISLVQIFNNSGSCTRCSVGVNHCVYQRLITVGGLNNFGATFTNAVSGNIFHFTAGTVLSLQQVFSIGYGIVDVNWGNTLGDGTVTFFNVYLLRPDG